MQIRWLTFGANPIQECNPVRPFVHRYNRWRMNRYVSRELSKCMAGFQNGKRTKSIMNLALTAYHSENPEKDITREMDSSFQKFAISQIKLFLFSGHDTTSSSICYLFYVLSQYPSALHRVRAEHDEILGTNLNQTTSLIENDPSLLNRLPHTLAVIKETLRLYPPVSSTRAGSPSFNVTDDKGRQLPTNDLLVWAVSHAVHRDPAYWPQPDEFIPERWLVSVSDPLHPVKGAWRPFEHGPRNCIAQELAMMEMKIIMVMVLRRFEIRPAYEELDRRKRDGKVKTVYGERGYQVQRAQPSEDLPCRVERIG